MGRQTKISGALLLKWFIQQGPGPSQMHYHHVAFRTKQGDERMREEIT